MGAGRVSGAVGAAIGWRPVSDDPGVASARIRCLNPLAELERRGAPVELYQERRTYAAVLYSKRYDAATIRDAERRKAAGTRIVFDLCDNHFYNPRDSRRLAVAADRLRVMLRLADDLVASTEAMAEVLRAETGGRPVTVIGDAVEDAVVQRERWDRRLDNRQRLTFAETRLGSGKYTNALRLVWFGVHGGPYGAGGMADLRRVRDALQRSRRVQPVWLTVISNSQLSYYRWVRWIGLPTTYLNWNPTTFVEALGLHHVAVVPVTPTPFTRCKSNNRVATALFHGLAVIADAIPSYEEFRPYTVLDDWERGLTRYAAQSARADDVETGRAHVRAHWTIGPIADQWQRFFEGLLR